MAKTVAPPTSYKKYKMNKSTSACHHFSEKGHFKRNCKVYLGRIPLRLLFQFCLWLRLKKKITYSYRSWVSDISGSNLCNDIQKIQNRRNLEKNEVFMRDGNVARVAIMALRTCQLSLPSSLVLELANRYYVVEILRNIIYVSYLAKNDRFCLIFKAIVVPFI